MERIFKITKRGRARCSSPAPNNRNAILDYLNSHNNATDEELAAVSGMSKYQVISKLKELAQQLCVEEVGSPG